MIQLAPKIKFIVSRKFYYTVIKEKELNSL